MEENKTKLTSVEKPQKMSYEQLENIAHQLSEQNKQLYMKLQEISTENIFKRLDFLFKVVKYKETFGQEFVSNCVTEIEDLITIKEEETKE